MIEERSVAGGTYVGPSPRHGRGVFATRAFAPDELIERVPVLVLHPDDAAHLEETALAGHVFEWDEDATCVALGHGSLYNHSYRPNARYEQDYELDTIDFLAVAPIAEGEEITINYHGEPDCTEPLWFDAADGG